MSNLLGLEEERPSTGQYDNVSLGPDPEWAAKVQRGANWFYWIAGLSVINSAAFVMGAKFHFLAGLGLTELADAVIDVSIQQGAPAALKAVAIVFDLIVVIAFALAGYFANKFFKAAFIIGVVVYAFDALLLLLLGDFFSAGFHVFALFFIVRGFLACRELKTHMAATTVASTPPPPPPKFGQS